MRTKVKIDGRYCDLDEGFSPPKNIVQFSDEEYAPGGSTGARQVKITLPSSPTNDEIVGFAADAFAAESFNAEHHTASIEVDGVELLDGEAALAAISHEGEMLRYEIVIKRQSDNWRAKLHDRLLSETALDFSATLNGDTISKSWQKGREVRFLPVHFDQYIAPYDQTSLYPPNYIMGVESYMPFISAAALLKQIFADAGYEVMSQFVDSDLFQKLLISGRYEQAGKSSERLDAIAGFCAGRTGESTAEADSFGRVYMSQAVLYSSLGSFVNTVESGVAADLYDNSRALDVVAKRLNYKSPISTTVRFELEVSYTTDYIIASRERLKCFDSIYLGPNCDMTFKVANPLKDRRNQMQPNTTYHCIIFNHAEGDTYRIVATTAQGEVIAQEFSSRSSKITMPMGLTSAVCRLEVKDRSGNFIPYGNDWAMYDGFVEDRGTTDVKMRVSTTPEQVGPSVTRYFDMMYLHGAEEGQSITLKSDCRLRTIFSPTPSLGSALTLPDIMHYDCTQEEFVDALQQLFNLRICVQGSKVYIEPKSEFYGGQEFDLSDRIVISEEIRAEELAAEHRATLQLGYRTESNGAVARFNNATEQKLGQWSTECHSALTEQGIERNSNPLFCPTLSATGILASAPSAALLQVGDRDSEEQGDNSMRIVRYEGTQTLRGNERWVFPTFGSTYPLAAFHYPAGLTESDGAAIVGETVAAGPAEPFTLCFESRDGAEGLKEYYEEELSTLARRRRMRVGLRVSPEELQQLTDYEAAEPSRRSLFRLGLGQKALYRLYGIEGYDASTGVAHCVMERMERD